MGPDPPDRDFDQRSYHPPSPTRSASYHSRIRCARPIWATPRRSPGRGPTGQPVLQKPAYRRCQQPTLALRPMQTQPRWSLVLLFLSARAAISLPKAERHQHNLHCPCAQILSAANVQFRHLDDIALTRVWRRPLPAQHRPPAELAMKKPGAHP
jgi:hypothetical protein